MWKRPRSRHRSLTARSAASGIDRAGRVVRRHRDDRARPRRDGRGERPEIELVVGPRRDRHGAAAGQHDGHVVVEVERHGQDDLVARIGDGQHGVQERHVAAGGHDHPAAARDVEAVLVAQLGFEPRHQAGQAFDRPVAMIGQLAAEGRERGDRLARRAVGDDALAERDRAGRLADPAGDDRDDGRLDGLDAGRRATAARGATRSEGAGWS